MLTKSPGAQRWHRGVWPRSAASLRRSAQPPSFAARRPLATLTSKHSLQLAEGLLPYLWSLTSQVLTVRPWGALGDPARALAAAVPRAPTGMPAGRRARSEQCRLVVGSARKPDRCPRVCSFVRESRAAPSCARGPGRRQRAWAAARGRWTGAGGPSPRFGQEFESADGTLGVVDLLLARLLSMLRLCTWPGPVLSSHARSHRRARRVWPPARRRFARRRGPPVG
jgi:hypothetical protein